ncbi:DNA-primase RepB domain-containing protein [Ruegeria sp. 6PALISEP08]|uniref:DNA-primase RepB domain-containing protein n=1 Tax=Ruegeria sp. 6PALISEP08 TaxID=1225660 RepID=UPI00067F0FAB|nr:DNA-primase RepB domain-containing protein [Ruegeria sp. 6PALISEP08]
MTDRRRIWLHKLVDALPCETFDIRIISLGGKVVACRRFTPHQFIASADWFAAMSAARHHVFFRPDGPLTHVLVDDISADALHLMACDGIRPSAVVETSPDNFQAWVTLSGRNHSTDVHAAACRVLAEQYAGDPSSAKPTQHGRVPTTRNPKPERMLPDGKPPLVLVHHSRDHVPRLRFNKGLTHDAQERALSVQSVRVEHTDTHGERKPQLGSTESEVSIVKAMIDEATAKFGGNRSRADAHVATFLLTNGSAPEQVEVLLMATSEKARERETSREGAGIRYVERTVQGSLQYINSAAKTAPATAKP